MSSSTTRSHVRTVLTAIAATAVALIALAAPASARPAGGEGHQVGLGYVWQNNSSAYWQVSPNGRNVLKLVQEDPATIELAVDHDNSGALSWQNGYSLGSNYAVWQRDGNLVVYRGSTATWASGTSGVCGGQCSLWVQDDGNVVIYKGNSAVWATNTSL
ncbi:MAG TPA: hypothetical protein VGJ45_21205 [Pseudonocardiaceae bacterium]|jgi:hypothetical protein